MQQVPENRSVSSSQRGSQAAALSKLAQIESRVRSRMQVQDQGPKPAESLTPNMRAASLSPEAPVRLSAQSNSEQSLRGKHFLKNKTAAVFSSPGVGVQSMSGAAELAGPAAVLERKPVSLESDEEDMRKLLGESLDSEDNSFRGSSRRTAEKMLSRSSQRVRSSSPSLPSSSSLPAPRSPASPPRRGSPFRFTGQAHAHFSPSLLSPSPSPRPQRSLSSMSGRGEVLSLEELFSEDPHSEMSAGSSEDFKMNVMTLDDLVPATLGFTAETPEKESKQSDVKHSASLRGSTNRHHQRPPFKEKDKQEEDEEEEVDYQSDFESVSRTDQSVSAVSEHLQGDGEEGEDVSEIREEASDSDSYRGRTGEDYSSPLSDTRRSCSSGSSDGSQTRSSRSSKSHGSRNSSRQARRRASTRKILKEAAVQTQPDPPAHTGPAAFLRPAADLTYMDPSPVVAHTLSAEMVEALSTFNPAVFVLNEMLKQQLAMTRRFIDSSRHLHCSLLQSLGPPDYRYTTLEDTKEVIRQRRDHRLGLPAERSCRR
ncbi:hypothetical protein PBY51_024095 [Eleginops maclovinus]|uniref:DUF4614 domain-containing protein n=2 Tax=Eleginops maclovinus TaxID=56733 RepID=A0AAN7Y0N1_ELEMC|nr:hypothetical protein PBY51_024095 [Eleginops maclovinus]